MAAPERFADTPDSFPLHRGRRPYMAAPERFADTPDSFPLHRGRRPYMAAPERFADTPDSFPLHRGRRPYMARRVGAAMSAIAPLLEDERMQARLRFGH